MKLRWLTIGSTSDPSHRSPINVKSVHFLDQTSIYVKTVDNLVYGVNLKNQQLSLLEESFSSFSAHTRFISFS